MHRRHSAKLEVGGHSTSAMSAPDQLYFFRSMSAQVFTFSGNRRRLDHQSMPPNRARRTVFSERACLQCQKRKTRCIPRGANEPCEYCEKAQRDCIFPQRASKTPLTRKNLDDAEIRCQELESLLEQSKATGVEPDVAPEHGPRVTSSARARDESVAQNAIRNSVVTNGTDNVVDTSPYEWDETLVAEGSGGPDYVQDGMASLRGSNVGTGYLGECLGLWLTALANQCAPGTTSGLAMFETISSTLSPNASSNHQATEEQEGGGSPPHYNIVQPLYRNFATPLVQDQLVSAYFECYNKSYPILHEGLFRAQCSTRHRLLRDDSWQMVFYMVLAIGEWAGGFSSEHHSVYYDAARSRFRPESLEKGNLTTVQAFLLMSNYLQKRDRPNTAFNFLAVAHRMAFGLGLHREPNQQGSTDTFSKLRRRTVFWILYCFDSGFSITTGRPGFMCDSFIDVSIPRNFDDTYCKAPDDQPNEVPQPTGLSAIIAQARLARIANKAYAQFSSVSPCTETEHQTSIMEHMLDTWRTSLPAYFYQDDVPTWFLGSRRVILWKEANVRILLLLASQRQRTDLHEKITVGQRYQSVAAGTLVDIYTFLKDSQVLANPGLAWYAVYFMLQAALALSVHELAKSNVASLPSRQDCENSLNYDQLMDQTRICLQDLARFDRNCARALHGLAQLQSGVAQSKAETNLHLAQDTVHVRSQQGSPGADTFNDVQSTEISSSRDVTNQLISMETANPPNNFPYGLEGAYIPGLHDMMDTSVPTFDNGHFLTGVFQDCYGPFLFGQSTPDTSQQ